MNPITNTQDVIDSRDVLERINELSAAHANLLEPYEGNAKKLLEVLGDLAEYEEVADDLEELASLQDLEQQAGTCGDWQYGATLILDSYFQEYAQELAEDCGMVPSDLGWPCCHIDWDAATDALKMDYTQVDFDGTEYWIRS